MTRTVVLLPAYNEAANIAKSIESLINQTSPPDKIVVIPNGCTDDTAKIAKKSGHCLRFTQAKSW